MRIKDHVISLISVVSILLAGMAMTGCATTKPLSPQAPLMAAAGQGNIDMVTMLLSTGIDVNQPGDCSGTFSTMTPLAMTPLACAAWEGHIDIVKLLLDKGANSGTKTSFQFSVSGGLLSPIFAEL